MGTDAFARSEPENMLGVPVPLTIVLHEDAGDRVIALSNFRAYPQGFAFSLILRRRVGEHDSWMDFSGWDAGDYVRHRDADGAEELPPEPFDFGFDFADGTSVGNLEGQLRDPPLMTSSGGGGSDLAMDYVYWVSPLAPEGETTAWCRWEAQGIPRTE